ncbi:MAG: hypothetical protein QF745_10375 [Planctomycetota bacterium]|jgi:hypothetical protein|nr:hypothetical protein [Parcubacteria group bacterium]MDP7560931.1 hypothetical protein [Planctomycetota bacterium]|tara:strand:- start:52 stop:516 length:465 start_codon:yes stop_codon:yes gene_type:complete
MGTDQVSTGSSTEGQSPQQSAERKIDLFLRFLRREMIGEELLFTPDMTKQVERELSTPRAYVHQMLHSLERKGLVSLTKRSRGKGFKVSFSTSGKTKRVVRRKRRGSKTKDPSIIDKIDGQIARHESEIARHKSELARKQGLRRDVVKLLGGEK